MCYKKRNRLQQTLTDKRGFTRLQTMMLVVLLLVIGVVVYYAFTGYNRSSYQVKADRTAQRVYDSAQHYLEIEKSAGRLESFNANALKYGGILTTEAQDEILKSLYKGSHFEDFLMEYHKQYKNVPIYYILMDGAEAGTENRDSNPIFAMLEYQLIDENITDNTFLIEYNANTGEVLSVLYSEKADRFSYEGDREGMENVIIRDAESLNRKWQGYCGVALEDLTD